MLVTYGYSSENVGRTGVVRRVTIPYSGLYTMVARGGAGHTGTIHNSSTGLDYEGTPGRGAIVRSQVQLEAGDELLICVGQSGDSSVTESVTDGSGGGSGGGTFVFRKIAAITDNTYQITIDGEYWECLLVAAGGSGCQDGGYRKSVVNAPDASTIVYSPSNYKAYSTTTASISASAGVSGTLSLSQIAANGFQGAYYMRNSNYGYGGFGCGSAADDNMSYGGGWAGSGTSYQSANWALYGGEARVAEQLENGAFSMSAIVEVSETISVPQITSVTISPATVSVRGTYNISVSVTEIEKPIVIESEFEFPFTNNSLTTKLLELSDITT